MKGFWRSESFWLAVGAGIAGVLASLGLGDLGATVKAAIDAGAMAVVGAYVHGSAAAKTSGLSSSSPAPVPQGTQVVADVLEQAATKLRGSS